MGCGCNKQPSTPNQPRRITSTTAGEQLRKALREQAAKSKVAKGDDAR